MSRVPTDTLRLEATMATETWDLASIARGVPVGWRRKRDDGVKLERWNRLQRRKRFLTLVRRGKKDEREDRKYGPKTA